MIKRFCPQCDKPIEKTPDGSTYSVSGDKVCSFDCFMNRIGHRAALMSADPVYDLSPSCVTIRHDVGPP